MPLRPTLKVIAGVLAALLLLGASIVLAAGTKAAPAPKTMTLACAKKDTGKLQYVSTAADCPQSRGKLIHFPQDRPVKVCELDKDNPMVRKAALPPPAHPHNVKGMLFKVAFLRQCHGPKYPDSHGVFLPKAYAMKLCAGKRHGTVREVASFALCNSLEFPVALAKRPNAPPKANDQKVDVNEDTAKSITLTGSDPDGDSLTFTLTSSPSHGTLSGTAPNLTYTPALNYSGADSFTFTAKDAALTSAAATVSITVLAGPTAGTITWNVPVDPVKVGTSITATASVANAQTATWNWGDGTTSAGTIAGGVATGSRTYAAPGLYTVTLTVTGAGSASATSVYQYVAVIDPLAGYETGSGSINSPAGSYTANSSLAGTAAISAFTAKYGADGTLGAITNMFRFSYAAAGFSFSSLSMKWLVISGNKSWLKGEGSASGVTDPCYFLVSVVDNTTTLDKVRVKIWNKVTGKVIYDNQKDTAGNSAPDDAVAVQSSTSPSTVILVK